MSEFTYGKTGYGDVGFSIMTMISLAWVDGVAFRLLVTIDFSDNLAISIAKVYIPHA